MSRGTHRGSGGKAWIVGLAVLALLAVLVGVGALISGAVAFAGAAGGGSAGTRAGGDPSEAVQRLSLSVGPGRPG